MRRTGRLLVGVVVATVAAGAGVLLIEAAYVNRRTYLSAADAPPIRGAYGSGPDLRLVVAGDSTGAGVGATSTLATVGGAVADRLARRAGRRVLLDSVAVSGARVADLAEQARAAGRLRPDVVLILVGANDATHRTRLDTLRRGLGAVVRALRAAGAYVVVGTCPDLGAARNFPQPLRMLVAWEGRRIAAAQSQAVAAAGGVAVPLARLTGPAFRADPRTLSSDEFHPSDRGYALWADAVFPAVLAGVGPEAVSRQPAGSRPAG